MNKTILNLVGLSLICAIWCGIYGAWGLTRHLTQAADSTTALAEGLDSQTQQTFSTINRPQTGTLAEINKATLALKSIAVHVDMAADHEDRQLTKYDPIPDEISALLHSGTGTLNAATETSQQASAVLSSIRTSTDQLPPLVVASTASVNDFDALLKDKAIERTLTNVDTSTANFAVVSGNFARVTTFYADDITKPKTFKEKMKAGVSLGFDALGFAFRHF